MKSRRSTFTLTFILGLLLAGVALWYFQSQPAAPQPASVAQQPVAAPVATPSGESVSETSLTPKSAVAAPGAVTRAAAPAPAAAPIFTLPAEPASPASVTPVAAAAAPVAPAPVDAKLASAEVAASARMYAAHASLREPEVADPDSQTNKKILSAMVAKALAQSATLPPTTR